MRPELDFLIKALRHYCKGNSSRLLEPACGTGRLILPLSRAGFRCEGYDINTHALNYLINKLNRNCIDARIYEADMVSFKQTGRKYDAAFCTVDTFRHLLTEQAALEHLINTSRMLKPGGIYILGMHLQVGNKPSQQPIKWTARRGRLQVKTSMRQLSLDVNQRREQLGIKLKAKGDKHIYKHESSYELRTYSLTQFKSLITKAGFTIETVVDEYYDLTHPIVPDAKTEYAVFILRKRDK